MERLLPIPKPQSRLRIFAGPNGSGKSTIIAEVRSARPNGVPIDFGTFINADDIAAALRNNTFSFASFSVAAEPEHFTAFAKGSGLLGASFNENQFLQSFSIDARGKVTLRQLSADERLAQLIARYLREELLGQHPRFSFETVFSHPSNLEIMYRAVAAGYKVYLYFVATESVEINKYRVTLRVQQGGHYVDPDKIEQRYYRALQLLSEAAAICHRVYFFDNSLEQNATQKPNTLVASASRKGKAMLFEQEGQRLPKWVIRYYLDKQKT